MHDGVHVLVIAVFDFSLQYCTDTQERDDFGMWTLAWDKMWRRSCHLSLRSDRVRRRLGGIHVRQARQVHHDRGDVVAVIALLAPPAQRGVRDERGARSLGGLSRAVDRADDVDGLLRSTRGPRLIRGSNHQGSRV